MAAYKTASLDHWRTLAYWCAVRDLHSQNLSIPDLQSGPLLFTGYRRILAEAEGLAPPTRSSRATRFQDELFV